jgi:hypothetical protein
MKRILLFAGLMLMMSALMTAVAQAGTIDSGAMTWESSFGDGTPGDAAGGTFVADEPYLNEFSLWLGVNDGGFQFNNLKPVVMEVDQQTGMPTNVIWQGASFEAIFDRQEYRFWPNVPIETGKEYFIGVDSNLLFTGQSSGDFTIQGGGDPIAGQFLYNLNGTGWQGLSNSDVRTTITTSMTNPEPGTATLLGMGLGLLGWSRKKKAAKRLAA